MMVFAAASASALVPEGPPVDLVRLFGEPAQLAMQWADQPPGVVIALMVVTMGLFALSHREPRRISAT